VSTVTLGRVARSEWLKLWTLRPVVMTYVAIAGALTIVAGVVIVLPGTDTDGTMGDQLLVMLVLVEMLVGVTGVLASTTEYSAQTVRSTFAAVPRRLPVLAAKVLVHGGMVLALFLPATVAGLAAALALVPEDVGSLTDRAVLQGIGGSALVFAATCVLGVALGVLTRSTPAAIGILFCAMFLPVMVTFAPGVTAYVPGRLAQAIVLSDNPVEARLLGGAVAAAVLIAWSLAAVAAAAVALRHRDA
jgi:ABC-2 type transport system permease protein